VVKEAEKMKNPENTNTRRTQTATGNKEDSIILEEEREKHQEAMRNSPEPYWN